MHGPHALFELAPLRVCLPPRTLCTAAQRCNAFLNQLGELICRYVLLSVEIELRVSVSSDDL